MATMAKMNTRAGVTTQLNALAFIVFASAFVLFTCAKPISVSGFSPSGCTTPMICVSGAPSPFLSAGKLPTNEPASPTTTMHATASIIITIPYLLRKIRASNLISRYREMITKSKVGMVPRSTLLMSSSFL